MITFLEETINTLKEKHTSLSNLTIILPSRRAGGFLLNYLKKDASFTSFAPQIISIETFIEEVSGIKIIDATELLFKSYATYLSIDQIKEKESFETYSSWATTLLGDFNEIDRYLIETTSFFNYLSDIQDINHWYVKDEKTPLIEKYLAFWNSLNEFYEQLKISLLKDNLGYQGLVYRRAAEEIEHYASANADKKHIFIGFNALNTAEQQIIQELLEIGVNEVYWDTDERFMNDSAHSASLFLRNYKNNWTYYKKNTFPGIVANYTKEKNFTIVSVQKNIGQVKYVGELLAGYTEEKLNETAIVLADENLLLPLLHSLPENVTSANITMGAPIKIFPFAVFFEILLEIKRKTADDFYYYKDLISLFTHPLGALFFPDSNEIITQLQRDNKTHITASNLKAMTKANLAIDLVFENWEDDGLKAVKNCLALLSIAKQEFKVPEISQVVLFQLHEVFTQINALQESFPYANTVKTIQSLFVEMIASTTLDFKGDAYQGLQIMGVLESRVLDFKNVIITSVNEGVLPSGKSNASFITYDLKHQFNLPKFTEKDAIYTYHFMHLLHRAQEATFLYNTHSDGLNGGEKSRFLLQLEVEKQPSHTITHKVLAPKVTMSSATLKQIHKTDAIVHRLQDIASRGFSPSALTAYVRNPIDFYFQRILKIGDVDMVEETVAANTLGTVVHEALENLYKPFVESLLSAEILKTILPNIEKEVRHQFNTHFKGDISKGKNLLIFEVAKKYVANFIQFEINDLNAGNEIALISLEAKLKAPIPVNSLSFPVYLKGVVDRVDTYNGELRIIDYKTGKVNQSDVEIVDWDDLTQDYKYSKAFQVLAYAMMYANEAEIFTAQAGIISFKNMSGGFLKFGTKEKAGARNKNQQITPETIEQFMQQASNLIAEICNPDIPFTEKEID